MLTREDIQRIIENEIRMNLEISVAETDNSNELEVILSYNGRWISSKTFSVGKQRD